MKLVSTILGLFFASSLVASADNQACCLCDSCEPPPADKLAMTILGLPQHQQTCADLSADLQRAQVNDTSELCLNIRKIYSGPCCSEGFNQFSTTNNDEVVDDEATSSSMIREARRGVLGSSSSSSLCSDNRDASNNVQFNTPGGACVCPVCKSGQDPTGSYVAAIFVPGKGSHSGSCSYMNKLGKDGHLTNGFCAPFQNALNSACCQS